MSCKNVGGEGGKGWVNPEFRRILHTFQSTGKPAVVALLQLYLSMKKEDYQNRFHFFEDILRLCWIRTGEVEKLRNLSLG
jgi:hypothetical protein